MVMTDRFDTDPYDFDGGGFDGEQPESYAGNQEIPLKYIHIDRETKAARLIVFEIDPDTLVPVKHWIPKSESALGSTGIIWVSKWLVYEKGIELYSNE